MMYASHMSPSFMNTLLLCVDKGFSAPFGSKSCVIVKLPVRLFSVRYSHEYQSRDTSVPLNCVCACHGREAHVHATY